MSDHGYVTLAAIEKAKAFLDESRPECYEYEKAGGCVTLRTDIYEGGKVPNFVIWWSGMGGDTYEAHFNSRGEFVKLIRESWGFTAAMNSYLRRDRIDT